MPRGQPSRLGTSSPKVLDRGVVLQGGQTSPQPPSGTQLIIAQLKQTFLSSNLHAAIAAATAQFACPQHLKPLANCQPQESLAHKRVSPTPRFKPMSERNTCCKLADLKQRNTRCLAVMIRCFFPLPRLQLLANFTRLPLLTPKKTLTKSQTTK